MKASQSRRSNRFKLSPVWSGVACLYLVIPAHAQGEPSKPVARLSAKLLPLQPALLDKQLVWVSDLSLKLSQQQLRQRILVKLESVGEHSELIGLINFIEALPVTGRLLPAQSDVALLLAQPAIDYTLSANTLAQPVSVPTHINALNSDGTVCQIAATTSISIEELNQQCASPSLSDEAWVIQADGSVSRLFTSAWNRFSEVLIAPGAWVWRPPRSLRGDASLSSDIANFLATQPFSGANPALLQPAKGSGQGLALGWRPMVSSNDWGETGLLQTPTARTGGLGSIRVNATKVYPYTRMNVFMQPTPWLEFGFRYTDIATALYGADIAGEQTYKDKSFDFKAVLTQETASTPQIAMGMRDIGGTGLFSSEYVVASKRFESFDWSLGLGWGNMASGGSIANPLGEVFPTLKKRSNVAFGQGGTIDGSNMFAGNAALFGGVQWTAPSGNTTFKLELDGNDYSQEQFGQNLEASSRLNMGWQYRVSPGVDVGLAWERGNRLSFSVTFSSNLRTVSAPKSLDVSPVSPWSLASARTTPIANSARSIEEMESLGNKPDARDPLAKRLQTSIREQTGWTLLQLSTPAGSWSLHLETDDAVYATDRLERLFDVLATQLPPEGKIVDIQLSNKGLQLQALRLDRAEWLAKNSYPDLPSLQLNPYEWQRPSSSGAVPAATSVLTPSKLETGWGTTFSHILGGPNNFLLYQAGVRAYGQYRFDENTWLFGQANLRLLDNYGNFVYNAPSNLPRVRTDQRRYVTSSQGTLPVAQLTRTFDLGSGHYASAYGGLLEPMYAGVGAEWLWRPWQSAWAFGVDANQVQQRAFEQDLALRDYKTTTGHATVYWNTGYEGIVAKVSAGKYLAKDVGVTVDLSRQFANGTSIGLWATKTNVSAEQFGEGSFDKGVYINIPLDALLPRSTPSMANIVWSPLTRDGGARLSRNFALFDLTRHADAGTWRFRSALQAKHRNQDEDNESASLSDALFPSRMGRLGLGESLQLGSAMERHGVNPQALATGAGAVLLSMALDQPIANQWGKSSGTESQSGKALSAIPYVLAAATGSAAIGLWGEDMRSTAYASLSATTWALGANMLGKTLIGRARPQDGSGPWEFSGPSSTSPQSSFASNHVTAAMALVTPFAQKYDQPWLYGLASLTALGRIQGNEHWASDAVAGGLLGYAFGSLALDQQTPRGKRVSWSASPTHVTATLRY